MRNAGFTSNDLIDLEFENARAALADGDHAAVITEYEEAHRAFEEAEARCEEIRVPYEESIQQAQQNYEAKRQEYLRMVEQIREQLDKAPDEYRQRFDEILANYNNVCSAEKERVIAAGGCIFSARNVTKAGASTTSCAGAQAVKAIPDRRASIYLSKTI